MPDESSTVSCPHCGQSYSVTAEQRAQYGRQPITCTRCQQPFTADGAPAGSMPPMPQPMGQPPARGPAYPYQGGMPTGQPVGYASPGPYGERPPTSGWAVTSLVL